ncbi:aldehyde ferredoxin oxidoreductase family protein [Halobellus ruber]|uniref:Aldehyde ferredoxin oxidoreductase n=1 Tax=Halobellus ruber TaxID=2761102 RepID=A0A7J9SI70_9EURY|nr:aldehyde ferredoxin oxidoreductase C-terminal domain-containing protein [Halobellus ruber]MBB6646654.1 aldehyde ferredoxin oxidoreductase [Halobellus ruber]
MTDAAAHLLEVDLTDRTVEREPVPERWLADYIGGKGLGARYLYDRLDAGTDPLGPDNHLLFALGPLSGLLPGETQFAAITRSPLTGTFLDSYSGGDFADALVGAVDGALGIAITGRADEPVVLELDDGEATLSPAADLWGRDVVETCEALEGAVACVGPAGENRVTYATIASDGGDHHAGRGGAGAVMGAKRLKAVVARGTPPEPDPEIAALQETYKRRYRETDVGRWHAASATLETVDFADEVGVLSTRGWQEGSFDGASDIGIEAVREAAIDRERDGEGVVGGFRVETDAGESVPRGGTPMSLGAGLGIDDFDAVAALGGTCDRLGLDVISAGNAVAWAIRAAEEGVVDPAEMGLDADARPAFGDREAARETIEAIAAREPGVPDALADGVEAAADRLGGADLVPTIKSMEVPAYDPRGSPTMALAYATSDRGACHRRSLPAETEVFGEEWDDADRVEVVLREQTITATLWSLIADDFAGAVLEDDLGAEWLAAVDAVAPTDPAELLRAGERIWTLTRLFNVREGFDAADETLPAAFERPVSGGPADGRGIDAGWFDRLRRRYYAAREWDENGVPSQGLLDRLDLLDVVDGETPVAREPVTQ